MKHYLFLDETGDHGLSYIDKNFPLFLLCGCVISEHDLQQLEKMLNGFKAKFFNSTEVILHSRNIRKCEGAFQILFDLNTKAKFYADLNDILSMSNYTLMNSAIRKDVFIKNYGKNAGNPYLLSLVFIVERVVFYLDSIGSDANIEIIAEERGKKEDRQLISHFNSVVDRGTYHVNSERLKNKIRHFKFHNKRDNTIGLQLADLCAYPMARHILNPEEPYPPFDIIESKIYCNNKGVYNGWGLKMFP